MREWQTVAGFQVRELLQRKVLYVLLLAAAVAVTLFGFALHMAGGPNTLRMVYGQIWEQLLTMMLVLSSLLVAVVAIFGAVGTVGLEMDSGRMQMTVSRPLRHRAVYLGHFAGLALVVGGFAALFYLAILLTFGFSTQLWPGGWGWGLLVFPLGGLWQMALAQWLATRLQALAAGVVGLVLLLFAWIGNLLEMVGHVAGRGALEMSGVLLGMILPPAVINGWVTGQLRAGVHALMPVAIGFSFGSSPSGWMVVYGLFYLVGLLGVGVLAFRQREL